MVFSVYSINQKFCSFPELDNVANSTAVILCSSGTTGQPKGVCRSHSQLIYHSFPHWDIHYDKQEVLFNFSTIYWATGIEFLIIGSLYGGLRVITTEAFEPKLMFDICSCFNVTTVCSATFAVSKILQDLEMQPFESVRGFMVGGSVVTESMCKSFQLLLPNGKVWACYGCSENGFLADSLRVSRYGSCGIPSQNVLIKIIDKDGNSLGPNQTGEICVKTKILFSGYFEDPEVTSKTIVNGWIELGDIGYFDDDGFLFFVSRKKEMLKYNGYQVYPSELEAIIDEIDGVKNSCVVGFTQESGNDLVFAIVVKNPEGKHLSERDIVTYVNARVIDAKNIRGGVLFIDAIPNTPSGKVLRTEAKELAFKLYHSRYEKQ